MKRNYMLKWRRKCVELRRVKVILMQKEAKITELISSMDRAMYHIDIGKYGAAHDILNHEVFGTYYPI